MFFSYKACQVQSFNWRKLFMSECHIWPHGHKNHFPPSHFPMNKVSLNISSRLFPSSRNLNSSWPFYWTHCFLFNTFYEWSKWYLPDFHLHKKDKIGIYCILIIDCRTYHHHRHHLWLESALDFSPLYYFVCSILVCSAKFELPRGLGPIYSPTFPFLLFLIFVSFCHFEEGPDSTIWDCHFRLPHVSGKNVIYKYSHCWEMKSEKHWNKYIS